MPYQMKKKKQLKKQYMTKKKKEANENKNAGRPPVVVVLGHVDHGKSSLLEAVKDLKITEKEAGGITQHIGAYMISHQGKEITFIDTPGHEAFFAMRSRGTKIADIGILVVAADEGVKKQTEEAIEHLKEAGLPFVVAINKTDKKDINLEKTKEELARNQVFVESYGGEIPSVNISAKKKQGIESLLEMVVLVSEMENLEKSDTEGKHKAEGVVIESKRDPKKGIVATFLIKKGTLEKGDIVSTDYSYGKIKTMENFLGDSIDKAEDSVPVQVTGFKECPWSGEDFFVFDKLNEAKKFASGEKKEEKKSSLHQGEKSINIILKCDVLGSLEAIKSSLEKIPQEDISIKIMKSDVGNITESDIEWAKSGNAEVLAFGVKSDKSAEKMAIKEDIKINYFNIIYELTDYIKEVMEKMMEPEIIKEEIGKVKVLAVFRTQKNRQILGGKIIKGEARKGLFAELWRKEEKIGEGKVVNIKKEEKDMEKISENEEMGMLFESKEKAEEGDFIVLYKEEEVKKTIEV